MPQLRTTERLDVTVELKQDPNMTPEILEVGCFNSRYGDCEGPVGDLESLGVLLCAGHAARVDKNPTLLVPIGSTLLREVTLNVEVTHEEIVLTPSGQIRASLEDGLLILRCQCGKFFYPPRYIKHELLSRENWDWLPIPVLCCPDGHQVEIRITCQEVAEPQQAAEVVPPEAVLPATPLRPHRAPRGQPWQCRRNAMRRQNRRTR